MKSMWLVTVLLGVAAIATAQFGGVVPLHGGEPLHGGVPLHGGEPLHGGVPLHNCGPSAPSTQRYGCEFFTQNFIGQYVCDRNQKPGQQCPPVRQDCTRLFGGPPHACVTDNDCAFTDKCCCDACLDHLVCKPSL